MFFQTRRMVRLLLMLSTVILAYSGLSCTPPVGIDPAGNDHHVDVTGFADQVIDRINGLRAADRLPSLQKSDALADIAQAYAVRMANLSFCEEVDPFTGFTATDRAAQGGYLYSHYAENVAAGHLSPEAVVQAWMSSATHRANILSASFTQIGVGVSSGSVYGVYWAVEFGAPP